MFTTSELANELRQSEIITGLTQVMRYDQATGEVDYLVRPYSVIVAQDCDLLRDFSAQQEGKPSDLIGVLMFEAEPMETAKSKLAPGNSMARRIKSHGHERYYSLEPVTEKHDLLGQGLPELLIDFRKYYTLPAPEIFRQCALPDPDGARRRCRLDSPFREHLQSRASYYFQRIALPDTDD